MLELRQRQQLLRGQIRRRRLEEPSCIQQYKMDRLAVNATDIVGSAEGPFDVSYTSRDLLLYALGIGATELRYLHEDYPHFCAFPTYPLVLPYKGTSSDVVHFPGEPVHGCPFPRCRKHCCVS